LTLDELLELHVHYQYWQSRLTGFQPQQLFDGNEGEGGDIWIEQNPFQNSEEPHLCPLKIDRIFINGRPFRAQLNFKGAIVPGEAFLAKHFHLTDRVVQHRLCQARKMRVVFDRSRGTGLHGSGCKRVAIWVDWLQVIIRTAVLV
jgi:hypothetical protein